MKLYNELQILNDLTQADLIKADRDLSRKEIDRRDQDLKYNEFDKCTTTM